MIYPAPRWFHEAVCRWLDEHQHAALRHRTSDLFTRLYRAQPPELRVVVDNTPAKEPNK